MCLSTHEKKLFFLVIPYQEHNEEGRVKTEYIGRTTKEERAGSENEGGE